jgi:hypothetical protein
VWIVGPGIILSPNGERLDEELARHIQIPESDQLSNILGPSASGEAHQLAKHAAAGLHHPNWELPTLETSKDAMERLLDAAERGLCTKMIGAVLPWGMLLASCQQ